MAPRPLHGALVLASLITCTNAAAILLSLLKELQKQSEVINHLAGISSQWCSDVEHQGQGMMQVIQGQLDDATIAVQQISSDEKRLESELTLAESTQQQREQQLQDATATSKFAAAEFASEQDQLNKTIEACQHAIEILKAEEEMDAQKVDDQIDAIASSLLQKGGNHMTDDEKNIMAQYASDPKPDAADSNGPKPKELLETVSKLHTRLQKQQGQAFAEQQVMSLRLWTFVDQLNSSIMESKSQSASINMEMAQRKREHTRLDGKTAAFSALRSKVETSKQAVAGICNMDAQRRTEIQKSLADESDSVRTTLKKMPALSSELLFDLSTVLPAAPTFTSFLQVKGRKRAHKKDAVRAIDPILKDLDKMAKQFTDDAASFLKAKQNLEVRKSDSTSSEKAAAPQDNKAKDSINGFASSSIQDIYAFLKSDDQGSSQMPAQEQMLLSNSGELNEVTGVYKSLLEHVHSKERVVDDQLKWCGSIARDAKLDTDAVARSLKWTEAKLNLAQVAMSEHKRTVAFSEEQEKAISVRSAQLQKLADVEGSELKQAEESLKQYSQQLSSLVTQLAQKSVPEERKGAVVVGALLEKLEKHQGLLEEWRTQAQSRREAVSSTLDDIKRDLEDNAEQSSRRLVKLKVESQVLASLVSSKAKDKQLSEKYVQLSQQLCSGVQAKQLQAAGSKLREEAKAVQKSLTALSQPLE